MDYEIVTKPKKKKKNTKTMQMLVECVQCSLFIVNC